ncbi:hypothetical protein [Telmatospirillum sp.]|uniref:hypothetical protein n=1 Tax=Telmatospirillum sp. TaxID=2079197 RepID=UPI002851D156|nr:hypothetical protein [Telmatospirillum sp.]MDR3437724.1 hypothetical protein [Telmatospirillum sp.]
MPSRFFPGPPGPDFHNNRRQAAIDHLRNIGVNPFETVPLAPNVLRQGSLANVEDRYLREMRTMPRLDVEVRWELAHIKEQIKSLTGRILEAQRT